MNLVPDDAHRKAPQLFTRGKLSRRLLLVILGCSTLFTLMATSLQLYLEYRDDVASVNENVRFIESSYVPALARSLYELNDQQLALQLSGALQINDVVYLKVVEDMAGVVREREVGSRNFQNLSYDEFELMVELSGEPFHVGRLIVASTTDNITRKLLTRALQILSINAAKTFIVALLFLIIIQQMVTRHISDMARWADQFSLNSVTQPPFRLNRRDNLDDELTHVSEAISKMHDRIAKDLEARETLEEKNRQLAQNLNHAEKLQSIGELAGGIAHDFNNQLHIILANADLMREEYQHDPGVIRFADNIIKSCLNSSDLISNLMTFSRKTDTPSGVLHINEVLIEVCALLTLGTGKIIEVVTETAADQDTVQGDVALIQNAFLNMGLNARDAMPDGGKLILSSENVYLDKGQFATGPAESGIFVKASVTDNGEGIASDIIHRVFDPFFTTKAIGKGTGMGLAAVYGTVRAHNGIIQVDSEPGTGTRFDLYFPVVSAPNLDGAT